MIICSPQLGISPESNLGGEVYDREILLALDELGAELLIILPFGKQHPEFKHAKLYFLPTPFVYPPCLFNLLILPYLFFLKLKYDFKILRVHNPYFVGIGALLFGFVCTNVKIGASYLHLESDNNLFDKILLPRFDKVTAISESTKEELVKNFKVPTEKISVVPCGVDQKYIPQEKNIDLLKKFNLQNKKVLLYLGQLIERKNIPFLFEVLEELSNECVLLICGDGPLKDHLKQLAVKKNLETRVIFTGSIAEDKKVDYYNLADVFLYPSHKEGFGLSVCEALCCGKQVIANNISVFREIKSNGLILLPLDASVWTKEIAFLRSKKIDPLTKYSWKKSAKAYMNLLEQII